MLFPQESHLASHHTSVFSIVPGYLFRIQGGFVAREDGKFDVYSAGGLGNNPRFGVKVAEAALPEDIYR